MDGLRHVLDPRQDEIEKAMEANRQFVRGVYRFRRIAEHKTEGLPDAVQLEEHIVTAGDPESRMQVHQQFTEPPYDVTLDGRHRLTTHSKLGDDGMWTVWITVPEDIAQRTGRVHLSWPGKPALIDQEPIWIRRKPAITAFEFEEALGGDLRIVLITDLRDEPREVYIGATAIAPWDFDTTEEGYVAIRVPDDGAEGTVLVVTPSGVYRSAMPYPRRGAAGGGEGAEAVEAAE